MYIYLTSEEHSEERTLRGMHITLGQVRSAVW